MLPKQPFVYSVHVMFGIEKQNILKHFRDNYLIKLKFGREGYF